MCRFLLAIFVSIAPVMAHAAPPDVICTLTWSKAHDTSTSGTQTESVEMTVREGVRSSVSLRGFTLDSRWQNYGSDPSVQEYHLEILLSQDNVHAATVVAWPFAQHNVALGTKPMEWAAAWCRDPATDSQ